MTHISTEIFQHANRPISTGDPAPRPSALCDSQRPTNVLTQHSNPPYRFFHIGDNANMPGHARPCVPANEPVRPITLWPTL